MIRSADECLADYLSRLDRTDAEEDGASGRPAKNLTEKIAALKLVIFMVSRDLPRSRSQLPQPCFQG